MCRAFPAHFARCRRLEGLCVPRVRPLAWSPRNQPGLMNYFGKIMYIDKSGDRLCLFHFSVYSFAFFKVILFLQDCDFSVEGNPISIAAFTNQTFHHNFKYHKKEFR